MIRSLRLLGRRLAGAQDGASATEFAIVFPMFFLLLFGIFEFAHACWAVNTLQYAVAQGARYAMTTGAGLTASNCTSSPATTSVTAYLNRQLTAYFPSGTSSTVTATGNCVTSSPTVTFNLTATYNFNFILSGLVLLNPNGITLQQKATVTTPLS